MYCYICKDENDESKGVHVRFCATCKAKTCLDCVDKRGSLATFERGYVKVPSSTKIDFYELAFTRGVFSDVVDRLAAMCEIKHHAIGQERVKEVLSDCHNVNQFAEALLSVAGPSCETEFMDIWNKTATTRRAAATRIVDGLMGVLETCAADEKLFTAKRKRDDGEFSDEEGHKLRRADAVAGLLPQRCFVQNVLEAAFRDMEKMDGLTQSEALASMDASMEARSASAASSASSTSDQAGASSSATVFIPPPPQPTSS